MRTMIGLVCVLLVAADAKDKEKKADDPLAGTWKVSALVANGQEREQAKGSTYTFADGKVTMKGQRGERVSTYKLDTSKKPATIDLTAQGGERNGQTTKGIYEVKGDEVKLCIALMPDAERPKAFASAADSGQAFITLKRDAGTAAGKALSGKKETDAKKAE